LIRCGGDRLAFRSDGGQIFVVRSSHIPSSDLTLRLVVSNACVLTSQNVFLTLMVSNAGPEPAVAVILTNVLPVSAQLVSATLSPGSWAETNGALTCNLGSLPLGGTAQLNLVLDCSSAPFARLTNLAGLAAALPDPFPANNSVVWTAIVLPDFNSDGLPDDWEIEYFGSTNAPFGGADSDFDHDGLTNLQEYLAGTDPADPDNQFHIKRWRLWNGTLRVYFQAQSGLNYQLEWASSPDGPWTAVGQTINGTGELNVLSDSLGSKGAGFYRVRQQPGKSIPGKSIQRSEARPAGS
jgi:uncharacterized repeat protein (TIGR01451 family)